VDLNFGVTSVETQCKELFGDIF